MTASVNRILLLGQLDADPELRYLPSGVPIATLTLTTYHRRRQSDGSGVALPECHRVSVSGRLAELARDRLRKGHEVYAEGRLRTETLLDQTGKPRKTTMIVAHLLHDLSEAENPERGSLRESEDMSWLDSPPPTRTTLYDEDIPF